MLLLKTKRYAEAGQAAGRLLRRGAGSAKAHYVAAVSLLAGRGSQSEALKHLRRAEDTIPKGAPSGRKHFGPYRSPHRRGTRTGNIPAYPRQIQPTAAGRSVAG
jgi:hypothetical protein